MANNPTVGIFLPGGQMDAYGNVFYTGSSVGKMIEVGDSLAASLTTPNATGGYATPSGLPLFGGAYQIVQVDSSATAGNIGYGQVAYIKLDSGPTAGALPETDFSNIDVTDFSHADINALFAGVFINDITPGNFGLIFVGAGRAAVNVQSGNSTSASLGAQVNANAVNSGGGVYLSAPGTAPVAYTMGIAVTAQTNDLVVLYAQNIFYRLPGV
jgi:hypothetical protein